MPGGWQRSPSVQSVVSVILTADKDQSLTHDAGYDVRDAALRSHIGRVPIDSSDFTDAGRFVQQPFRKCQQL